jgi:uncharacterized protein (TIGR02145 family)
MKKTGFLTFALLIIIFSGCNNNNDKEPQIPEDGVLINGIIWAKYNVDMPYTFATTPENCGMFYQWNKNIGWSNLNFLINSNEGTVWDTNLTNGKSWEEVNDPSPDGWRVPTANEFKSLLDKTKVKREWVTQNRVNGIRFTDIVSNNNIFLPAAGNLGRLEGELFGYGVIGCYYSSIREIEHYAFYLWFDAGDVTLSDVFCINGLSIRCVVK